MRNQGVIQIALLTGMSFFAMSAHAQTMFKCVTPAGGIEYRGSPCTGSTRDTPMANGTYSNVDGMSRHEIQRTMRPAPESRQQYQQQQQASGSGAPSELDIRNMETSASSITLDKREKMKRQAEIAAAKDRRAGGSGQVDYSAVDAEDQRTAARRQATAKAAQPRSLVNCDSAGCWDTSGARYNKSAGDGNFFRQDGKACQTVGNQVRCN